MSFWIKRTTLSPQCRKIIEDLFERKHMKVDLARLFEQVECDLRFYECAQRTGQAITPVKARYIRQQIRKLVRALHGLNAVTEQLLADRYLLAYPMPPPKAGEIKERCLWGPDAKKFVAQRVLNQTAETHFIRMDGRGLAGLPVKLEELIARLQHVCELAQKDYRPPKGAPVDNVKVVFVMCMMETYEQFSPRRATSTPAAAFDMFLDCILQDVSDCGVDGASRRKLIESADARRRKLDAEGVERTLYLEATVKYWGEECARSLMKSNVLPVEVCNPERVA